MTSDIIGVRVPIKKPLNKNKIGTHVNRGVLGTVVFILIDNAYFVKLKIFTSHGNNAFVKSIIKRKIFIIITIL